MALPPRPFFTLLELAARWGCEMSDVAGWAALGHLPVVIGLPPVFCGTQPVAGIVAVAIADMMQMFRRFGSSEETCVVRRVQPYGSDAWFYLSDPEAGVAVRATDLMVPADDVLRFEEERDLLRRPSSSVGSSPRYDWDAMYVWLFQRLLEQGFPATQAALVAEAQEWFVRNARSGEVPEDSTIRKRLTALWRAVREAG